MSTNVLFNNTVIGVFVPFFSHKSHFLKAVQLVQEGLQYIQQCLIKNVNNTYLDEETCEAKLVFNNLNHAYIQQNKIINVTDHK